MTRLMPPLLASSVLGFLVAVPFMANAQANVPDTHPGFVLAEAIAAGGCVLHQDDVNGLLDDLGLDAPAFPMMAVPLMQDGFLMPSGQGTLTLVNWGLCTGEVADDAAEDAEDATTQPDSETSDPPTE